ncbi:MAG: hypothetical protein U1G08_21095 [Verrucomicrobiota bacterium]
MNLRYLLVLLTALLFGMPAKAQYQPIAKGVSVNPTNSILQGPLDFFYANSNQIWRVIGITNLDSLAKATNGLHVSPVLTNATVKGTTILPAGSFLILPSGLDIMAELAARGAATNGLFVGPTLTNANLKGGTTIPSGASLSGAPGAQIGFDRVTISGTPSNPTDATTKGAVDSLANIIFLVVPPGIYNNLSELVASPVSPLVSRFGYVRNSTGGDGAAGPWIWDPGSTIAEGAVVKKSPNLSPSDPGRWIKL